MTKSKRQRKSISMCGNKRSYKTKLEAKMGLLRVRDSVDRNVVDCKDKSEPRVYKCDRCSSWHITFQLKNNNDQ